jgi:hypothetical protein
LGVFGVSVLFLAGINLPIVPQGLEGGCDRFPKTEAIEDASRYDFKGRAAFVTGGMTQNMAVKEFAIEA